MRVRLRTAEEVAGARKGEISAHIKGLVADLRNDYFYADVSKRERVDLDDVLDSGLAERLAAFEQHLLARFCKYEPEWYHDNGKYKSVFLGVLREVEDARSRITDPASALSRQLASVSAGMASVGSAAADPKPGKLLVMSMQGVVRQMQNAVQELHAKFFQVCHSITHARAHTHT